MSQQLLKHWLLWRTSWNHLNPWGTGSKPGSMNMKNFQELLEQMQRTSICDCSNSSSVSDTWNGNSCKPTVKQQNSARRRHSLQRPLSHSITRNTGSHNCCSSRNNILNSSNTVQPALQQ